MTQENKTDLPQPDCNYADHSYPAYSKRAVIAIVEATKAIERERYISAAEYFEKNPMQFQGTVADYFRSLK